MEKEKRTIILTRGIQGSGKSTWAKLWVAQDKEHRIRWNNDDVRLMFGPYTIDDWKSREKIIRNLLKEWLRNSMNVGYNIVIDNLNLSESSVNRVISVMDEFNKMENTRFIYNYEFKDFFIPVDECIRRDSLRSNKIGEAIIRKTWKTYKHKILQIETAKIVEKQNSYYNEQSKCSAKCIIADMDATVCFNMSGRPYYGEGSHVGMINDIPNLGVISCIKNYLDTCNIEDRVFIITGRDNTPECRDATLQYIKKHISDDPRIILLMRPVKENMPAVKLKEFYYNTYIKDKYYIEYAIDDSEKVVNMYRDLGITVFQPVNNNL